MTKKSHLIVCPTFFGRPGVFSNWCQLILGVWLGFIAVSAHSAPQRLAWDASSGTGPNDGNGDWFGTNVWWSTSGSTNYTWNGTGDEEFVSFGAGTPGNYFITNDASIVQPFGVAFTNAGTYTIVTDGTDAGQLQTIVAGGGTSSATNAFYVATNVTAIINVPWRLVATADFGLGSNSVLTFGQGTFGTLGQITFKGSGPAASTINATNGTWGGTGNPSGTTTADGVTFNVTGAAVVNFGTRFDIARSANAAAGYPIANAIVNVGGPGATAQLNVNTAGQTATGDNTGNNLQISRGGPGVLNVLPGGLVSTLSYINSGSIVSGNMRITPDSSSQGAVNISGGTVNVGIGASGTPGISNPGLTAITLFDATTPSQTASATLNISGGTVSAKNLAIGSGGTWTANPTNQVNISGGTVYLDAPNISLLNYTGTNFAFNVSGGTIAATANWSPACSVPMNLTNVNGNITFQAADASGNPFNMAFSGALTGVGGLYKSGGGTLTLSGTNTYGGATVVSNGTLAVSTLHSPVNGPLTLDGSAGTPTVSVQVANVGQQWSIGGLTYASGSPTADFNFGNFSPSATVAAVQVNGGVAFDVTPLVTVEGAAIPAGTYPLISYTGVLSGTAPTTVTLTLTGGSASGYVTNIISRQMIALVVTSSTYVPAISWGIGNGNWDFTSANWIHSGSAVDYVDGDSVLLDDTASGTSPITVTLNTAVNPGSVTVNNSAKNYIIASSGDLAGGTGLTKDGTGFLTLSNANTYSGGTMLNAGQLNLDYGGNGAANSAIGTGPLTIKLGTAIDNTSDHAVTLLPPIQQTWNDDFSFIGSANLNMGSGAVTLGSASVSLTVNSNIFEVDGQITDNGAGYGIAKSGNGTLILSNANSFSGGLNLSSGTLDINNSGADGTGPFLLSGGILDNTSGNSVTLSSGNIQWKNAFTFNGSNPLDMGSAPIGIGNMTMTINSNTLYTEGPLNGANTTLTLDGQGTWTIGGSALNNGAFGLTINGGVVNCDRGFLYNSLDGAATVNTNASLVMENPVGTQMATTASIILSGGLVELNGDPGEIFQSITFDSGILRNSANAASFTLSQGVSLVGTNCDFDVTNDSSLEVDAVITNTGSLYETGNGILTLTSNDVYTGSTIIEGGTLALDGSISNTALISVHSGTTLDVSGRSDQTLTLNAGQTLTGKGSLNGNLVASPGSIVAPGGTITAGTFTVANNASLNGTLLVNLDNTNTPNSSQIVSTSGTITYAGTLSVTNTGPTLQVGNTFQLFPSAVTTFANINLPTTDASGDTYTWNDRINVNGSITVATVTPPGTINPNPGKIQFSISGSTLSLAWPTNSGWLLQTQTNSLAVGIYTNWVTVPGSAAITSTNITINPGIGSVFYRMVHP